MTKILYLSSSANGEASYSGIVAGRVINELQQAHPGAQIKLRDLAKDALPHIDGDFIAATRTPEGAQTERQRKILAKSDELVDELIASDIIVIAAPMYNFSIPSTLKAWIDYVCRSGRTFRYTEKGPEGLVTGKRVIVVSARGGIYSEGPAQAMEFQSSYLRAVLGFIGLTQIETIDVEGIALGPDSAKKALVDGLRRVEEIVPSRAAA